MHKNLKHIEHEVDFCVVGGGLAGMCAAVAAARHGLTVALMHDRPVFGGNASSEVRVWISGAQGDNVRETGIIEEISLETLHRNPYRTYPLWDCILYECIKKETNIIPILNCSCNDAEMCGNKIVSISGWQTTTQQWHTVRATYFADCSGDSILAPLSGAEFRMGREARSEFGEAVGTETADEKTMGNSCLMQTSQAQETRPYTPPQWARKFTKEDLPRRTPHVGAPTENFWFMELGGDDNTIDDAEQLRDELLKVAYGIWDYVKNTGDPAADSWELDWLGYLPGKRESRRYVGDYILTLNDLSAEGRFDDSIAYGGWPVDDHNPAGINSMEPPNNGYGVPSAYGIPYRCVYSKNIENLFFAGRNISATHIAMSSARVMATCALLGQAVGSACAVAHRYGITPREVYLQKIGELQHMLMEDDCYIPFHRYTAGPLTEAAEITTSVGNGEVLRNGHHRPIGTEENCLTMALGEHIVYSFDKPVRLRKMKIVLDSDLNRETIGDETGLRHKTTVSNRPLDMRPVHTPVTLVKDMQIMLRKNGVWEEGKTISDNYQRVVDLAFDDMTDGVKLIPLATHGCEEARIFAVYVY